MCQNVSNLTAQVNFLSIVYACVTLVPNVDEFTEKDFFTLAQNIKITSIITVKNEIYLDKVSHYFSRKIT